MGLSRAELLPHYTYKDYCGWEGRWELIRGIVHAMTPAPSIKHQQISQKIARHLDEALENCSECHPLLPVDWKISDDTVVQPDNLVVCYKPEGNYITKAPTLIFEVLSSSTSVKDENVKFNLYQKEGVRYYCIVVPDDKVAKIYELMNGIYIKKFDATNETIIFVLKDCVMEFDFSKIWD